MSIREHALVIQPEMVFVFRSLNWRFSGFWVRDQMLHSTRLRIQIRPPIILNTVYKRIAQINNNAYCLRWFWKQKWIIVKNTKKSSTDFNRTDCSSISFSNATVVMFGFNKIIRNYWSVLIWGSQRVYPI